MKTTTLQVTLFCLLISFCCALTASDSYAQNGEQVKRKVPHGYKTKFLVYTPEDYRAIGEGEPHPLLISLHGGSGIGDSLDMLTHQLPTDASGLYTPRLHANNVHLNPSRLIYNLIDPGAPTNIPASNKWDPSLPFVVVSPQLRRDPNFPPNDYNEQTWPPDLVDELIEYVKEEYNVDDTRIYLTGISLGATGVWEYAAAYPEKLAAIMPLAGKGVKPEACKLKDLPTWAFHGDNDGLLAPHFTTEAVEAMRDCSPAGAYKPHLSTPPSMEHDIWQSIYTLRAGYDIYDWFLSFQRGNYANKAPFVYLGHDKKIRSLDPFSIPSEYFDMDGSITSVLWTQTSGPTVAMSGTTSPTLQITPVPGTLTFRLTVQDNNGGVSYDEITITVLTGTIAGSERIVDGLKLYNHAGGSINPVLVGPINEGDVFDLNTVGNQINIEAEGANISRVRWSINSFQHTRDNSSPLWIKAVNQTGLLNSGWTIITKGTYVVCATPFANNRLEQEGTSLCRRITFSDEVGTTKYYLKSAANPTLLASWGPEPDGSGVSPSNFTSANQWFIIPGAAAVSSPWTVSGANSRIIIADNGDLTASAVITGEMHIEGRGKLTTSANQWTNSTTSSIVLKSVSSASTVVYDGTSATTMIAGQYGNLIVRGSGVKTLGINGAADFKVRKDFIVEPNASLTNNGNRSGTILISGNATIQSLPTVAYTLRFLESFGVQRLTIPGDITIHQLFIDWGSTVEVISPSPSNVIRLGATPTNGGLLELGKYTLFKLNGRSLIFGGNGNLSTPTQLRPRIELDNSTLTFEVTNPGSTRTSLIFPEKGKNKLKGLIVSNGAGTSVVNIMDTLIVTERVSVQKGTLNTNGKLKLQSDATSTAYISPLVGSGVINGNVMVERHIKPGKVYRYLGFPVTGSNVAELQNSIGVTGNFSGSSPGSSAASMYEFNLTTRQWVPYPPTGGSNTAPLVLGKGYAVYVRDAVNPEHSTVTGTAHTGNFNYHNHHEASLLASNPTSIDTIGWSLLANPYAAPILWGGPGWTSSGVASGVSVRDNDIDDFRVWNGSLGDPDFGGLIASGQAFWVRSIAAAPTLTVAESAKQELTSAAFYRTQTSPNSIRIRLSQNERHSNAYIGFGKDGKLELDPLKDAVKQITDKFAVSILSSDSVGTAIKYLNNAECYQEIVLAVQPKGVGTFSLTAEGAAFDDSFRSIYLIDSFKKTRTLWKENEAYVFDVTGDPASAHVKRFKLGIYIGENQAPQISYLNGTLTSSIADVQWMLNGTDIEGAVGATYAPQEPGEYQVRSTTNACAGISDAYTFRITDVERPQESAFSLYPNPASTAIRIKVPGGYRLSDDYKILSVSGAVVQQGFLQQNESDAEVNIQHLAPGMYLIQVRDIRGVYQLKFRRH